MADTRQIWFWQEDSLSQVLRETDITDSFLKDKTSINYSAFQAGAYFTAPFVGRYGLAIQGGPRTPDAIVDTLGATIENSVTYQYFEDRDLLVLISKNYITPSTFFLKLTI